MEFTWVDGNTITTMHLDIPSLIGLILFIWVILAIIIYGLYLSFSPVKVRNIIVVKTRKTIRDLPNDPKTHPGSKAYYTLTNTTVDFIYVGKQHVHTYFCDERLKKKLVAGHTYKVKMQYPNIIKIIEKNPIDK